jgi:hypothetical protein
MVSRNKLCASNKLMISSLMCVNAGNGIDLDKLSWTLELTKVNMIFLEPGVDKGTSIFSTERSCFLSWEKTKK